MNTLPSTRRPLRSVTLRRLGWTVAVLLGAVVLLSGPRPSSALDVVACLSASAAVSITSDPRACPSDRVIDAVAGSTGWTVPASGGLTKAAAFELTKRLDRTSPTLFLDAMMQRRLQAVLIAFFDSAPGGTGRRLYSMLLSDVGITTLVNSAGDTATAGALPVEVVTLQYRRITVRDDVSGAQQCWDFTANRGC